MFDSVRGHLGGPDVRTDQNDQKVDFKYPPPISSMSILGIHESPQKIIIQNFPIWPIPRKLNSKGIGWIRYLQTSARSRVLVVPRLPC